MSKPFLGGGLYEGLWLAATLVILWGFVKKKQWFFSWASIYAIVFLIRSFRDSVLFLDITLAIAFLVVLNKNKESVLLKKDGDMKVIRNKNLRSKK